MVDTPRTLSQLITAAADNTIGAYVLQNQRDLIVSGPLFDDPANVSGLGAPAILRGTVNAALAAGVTVGSGQTTTVRQNTFTGLQNAINYAASADKFFEIPPGVYEIDSTTGLTVPQSGSGFVWRGASTLSQIIQFNAGGTGVPGLILGDSTGALYLGYLDFDGVFLAHGSSQTGLVNSCNIMIGPLAWSRVKNVITGSKTGTVPTNPTYNGLVFPPGAGTFSCVFEHFQINGAQHDIYHADNMGTGNAWTNFYLNGGGGQGASPPAISGVMFYQNVSSTATEQHWTELNCEWCSCNSVMNIQNDYGLTFHGLHIEGINLTGANPTYIGCSDVMLTIDGFSIGSPTILSANFTGSPSFVANYTPSNSTICVNQLNVYTTVASGINTTVTLFVPANAPADTMSTFDVRGMRWNDPPGGNFNGSGRFTFDSHMPNSASAFICPQLAGSYTYRPEGSTVERAAINVSATYTHYGQLEHAMLSVPATITPFTITLAATMGATGNQKPRTGNTVHVRRMSGTYSGALTITNGGAGGGNLTNGTTAAADFYYQFDGTNWVAVTPVT